MARGGAVWKGRITFGLVGIPVELVPAIDTREHVGFQRKESGEDVEAHVLEILQFLPPDSVEAGSRNAKDWTATFSSVALRHAARKTSAPFTEWTGDGKLRHPSFQGLREDKPAREGVRESTVRPRVRKK